MRERNAALVVAVAISILVPALARAAAAPEPAPTPEPPAVQAPDPIEGKWAGEVGSTMERAPISFSFERDAAGKIHGYLYQFAYIRNELPGVVTREPGPQGAYHLSDV